jgi:signal transduction histidine kinase
LLDTIEHVLDFSKIKRFGQESSQSMGVVTDLDISAVIEEVLQSVYAGFEFNGLSSQGLADSTRSEARNLPPNGTVAPRNASKHPEEQVTVIINIDFKEQWKFPTAAGTLKRLAMNVFGNALKYTQRGYIKVDLEARPIATTLSSTKTVRERTMVTLTVTDSGQGMSSEFIKTKLFMPFSKVWILYLNLYTLGAWLLLLTMQGGCDISRHRSRYEYRQADC